MINKVYTKIFELWNDYGTSNDGMFFFVFLFIFLFFDNIFVFDVFEKQIQKTNIERKFKQ